MNYSIEIKNVTLRYPGTDFNAVDNLSLSIQKGEIFGLLGPNGAGKTSLISLLTGLNKPHAGTILIDNNEISNNIALIRRIMGVVPQEYALYPKLTAKENLQFFGSMFGLSRHDLHKRITAGIEEMGLTQFANKRIETFSGGMKRRINLLAGVLHQPKILFLDEPTVGVDVHSKQFIINYLKRLNQTGTTIIYTSHMLHEAQTFCTRVAIIDSGAIKLEGETQAILLNKGKPKSLEEIFIEITQNDKVENV